MSRQTINALVAAMVLAAVSNAHAADAGSVTFATGTVTAEREPAEVLARGDAVRVDDTVITAEGSRAQLVMVDDARIAIRPNSRIEIAEYVYAGAAAPAGSAVVSSDDNSSVLNLVKGGFRTITGAIASEDADDYEVRTAVGVLGVRGTDFAVLLCGGDCNTAPGVTPGATVPDGLYLMVTDGTIEFRNEVASLLLNAGEFAYIPFDTREPARLDAPPPVFLDVSDFRFDEEAAPAAAAPAGFDAALGTRRVPDTDAPESGSAAPPADTDRDPPAQQIRGIDADGSEIDLTPGGAQDSQNRTIGYSSGSSGPASSLDNEAGAFVLDTGNNVTGFSGTYPGRTGPETGRFDIGTASNVDSGFDSVTALRWGRWSGGTARITFGDGTTAGIDLNSQSLHWVSSPAWATAPVMPISGTATYTLVGATSPTDNLGNIGVLGDASFFADFTNNLVDSTLNLDIGGGNWSAVGQGSIGSAAQLPAHLFQGFYNSVTITGPAGTSTGVGSFSGFFSEPGTTSDPSYPGGVGLTYTLQDQGAATTVSGAAVFGSP